MTQNIIDEAPEPEGCARTSIEDLPPEKAAWRTTFFLENHLDHFAFPDKVGSPEQMRFMVYLDEYQRYYPCSDRTFEAVMSQRKLPDLRQRYRAALKRILNSIEEKIEDKKEKKYLSELLHFKFQRETRDQLILPTRLEKRLIHIYLNRTQIEDPWADEKAARNLRADTALRSQPFYEALNHWDPADFEKPPANLAELKEAARQLEFMRLLSLTGETALWEKESPPPSGKKAYLDIFKRPIGGNGLEALVKLLDIRRVDLAHPVQPKRILWLTNESGEVMVDLALIRYLTQLGHKVIISFMEGPLYTQVNVYDTEKDRVLANALGNPVFLLDRQINKNDLVRILRQDSSVIVLSDGTQETLNLLLTSTTFARVFKEVDAVISRGELQRRRFFETHFQFTQDIYNIFTDSDGTVCVSYNPRHSGFRKFSHADLEKKARAIIDEMVAAKKNGMTVVFYSGIIGSIPGKIRIAKHIMTTFIDYLKKQLAQTFIINPSQYFEPGMDADDLMYMWEIVQTSGYIDIWRFQSYEDIAQAFKLLDRKVPPEWVGKDATFSTGCTKEMKIAERVQQQYPEMQIIGPAREKFMRRQEYGVGQMFDQRLKNVRYH
jgi:uncharacterized protein with ATP-grasp and redox domains